jgi:hypothetical protein
MGSVSIADMERVALGGGDSNDFSRSSDGIGNVIELGDLSDDLGLSMLANPSKISVNHDTSSSGRNVTINNFSPPPAPVSFQSASNQGGLGTIDISPLEPMEPISFTTFDESPQMDTKPIKLDAPAANSSFGGLFGNSQTATGPGIQLASLAKNPEEEKKEKSDYLNKLQRLEQKGFPVARKFTMDNSLDEIKTEYFRLVDARQLETSIKFQRQMLMGAITGMEWLNGRFDPFDVKLDGWSESVHENIEDFDEIFEELYDKYKDRGKMSPEMRLLMAVGGSGFMCHVSNSFFRSKMPNMDDVLRRNPDLARQMAAAAAQQAGPGFGNFMGMAMGVQPPPSPFGNGTPMQGMPGMGGMGGMGGMSNMSNMQGSPLQNLGPGGQGQGPSPMGAGGAFFGASSSPSANPSASPQPPFTAPERQTARREMSGPTGVGVDDILKVFEEVRRSEISANAIPEVATGYPTQPAVAAVTGMYSDVTADEVLSETSRGTGQTGATSGRRRRKAQAPVGNTVAVYV